MNPQERFVAFLQEHPGYYLIAKSGLYINLLSLIEQEASEINALAGKMPGIEFGDLELMLKSLISLNLVGVLKTDNKTIYYTTQSAKEFLLLYKSTKTGFGNI